MASLSIVLFIALITSAFGPFAATYLLVIIINSLHILEDKLILSSICSTRLCSNLTGNCFVMQGLLSSTFPVENRITTVTLRALKDHLSKARHLPFVKRISDFHLLLLLARYLDVNADVPALAACVHGQTSVPEGYQLLIESLAAASWDHSQTRCFWKFVTSPWVWRSILWTN